MQRRYCTSSWIRHLAEVATACALSKSAYATLRMHLPTPDQLIIAIPTVRNILRLVLYYKLTNPSISDARAARNRSMLPLPSPLRAQARTALRVRQLLPCSIHARPHMPF